MDSILLEGGAASTKLPATGLVDKISFSWPKSLVQRLHRLLPRRRTGRCRCLPVSDLTIISVGEIFYRSYPQKPTPAAAAG
jgi:hypothetical protein